MRNWGIIVTAFYAVTVLILLIPGVVFITAEAAVLLKGPGGFWQFMRDVYTEWFRWVPIGIVVFGQALLLFLSVDTSKKRLKPRAHILVSCLTAGMLLGLLTFAAIASLAAGVFGDNFDESIFMNSNVEVIGWWGCLWLFWGIVFYLYLREAPGVITRAISWLLKGSVLELLVAVPCHVVVRYREDCSAPLATAFGIATGIAIMLLSFGPSVLLLYKKRLNAYSIRRSATE